MCAVYNEIQFKTNLEAAWAAFFDLAGWKWWNEPCAIGDWKPDFKVVFPCSHSECSGSHTLLASVLPVHNLNNIAGHPALLHSYNIPNTSADGGALFGSNPSVTKWEISHGSGGGIEDVYFRVENADELWVQAIRLVEK